jgi:RimJ/RimL family protein N-acetyltransferase
MKTTPEITIRPHVLEDIERHHEAVAESIEELSRWMPWCHAGYSIEDSRGWIEARIKGFAAATDYTFAIVDRDNRVLGSCGLGHLDVRNLRANLGYWVRTSCLGRGVATIAVRLVSDWTFANTEFQRLEIVTALGNTSSQRVAEKAGAVREGLLRSRLKLNGILHDAVMNSIIRPDSNRPIQSSDPTPASVTPSAGQESRPR